MTYAIGAVVSVIIALAVWLFIKKELTRRDEWFTAARAALGGSFGPFEAVPSTDRNATKGQLEGAPATFAADRSVTLARLEVPLKPNIDRGLVFNLIVREEDGALETSREDVLVGWDDEHGWLVFRTRARPDAAATVKTLIEEAKAFQERLPALLDERAKARSEAASKTFGDETAPNGRHKTLGLALPLSPDEWELVRARPEGIEWERIPPGEDFAPPVELRLYAIPSDEALADETARLRLIERLAGAHMERLPDGSFEGPTPDPRAASMPAHAGAPSAGVVVDHLREVVTVEEESASQPYRVIFQGIFLGWGVAVFALFAPRAEADALLARLLAGATFEKPV